MNGIKIRKKESNYLLWISKIINEDVTNVNILQATVLDVKLSNDGSILKIFVSFLSNEERSLNALNSTKGFIRRELAKYEKGRKVPNLVFEIDQVSKTVKKIDEILKEIKSKEKSE